MLCQHTLKILVVFNNAIVHEVDITDVMRVCIALAWLAMRCPARMANSDRIACLMSRHSTV
ncbi:hypothetical protein D3C87_1752440 [compost metagenome]